MITLSVVTTAPMVPTNSAIILTAATIAYALTDTTKPTMLTLSVLTSTNVLMEHTTGFQGNGHLLHPSREAPTACVTSTSVMSHHAMLVHNSQVMMANIPVLVAMDIAVMIKLVKTSTNVRQPCLVANVVLSKVNSIQPNHVLTVVTTVMPMFPVPTPSVLGLVHVIPDMMVTVLLVLLSTNVVLTHVTLMTLAVIMMNHTPAPLMTASTVMVKHILTSMSVFQPMPVTPMLPVRCLELRI